MATHIPFIFTEYLRVAKLPHDGKNAIKVERWWSHQISKILPYTTGPCLGYT